MRMSRRMGLVKSIVLPSLYELWSDATVVTCLGASSSTAQYYTELLLGDTSTPLWVIASTGDSLSFNKVKDNILTSLQYYYMDVDNITACQIYISSGGASTTNATKIDINPERIPFDPIYGYVLAALRFPSFSEAIVDVMMKRIKIVVPDENAYHYGSSASSVYIADADLSSDPNDVYLQFAGTSSAIGGYLSATRGGTPETAIMTSGSRAFWRHANSRYYFSSAGGGNTTTRAGGLYRLSL